MRGNSTRGDMEEKGKENDRGNYKKRKEKRQYVGPLLPGAVVKKEKGKEH